MARQVLPWVGAAVGSIWGQPQLGFAIGSIVGNIVDPQVIKGPSLGEGQNNTASEGGYRPIVLGKGAVGVCMIHEGPIKKRTIRHRQSKGGGPVTEEERAYRTMAFALGESAYPDTGVQLLRLWIDNKLRYDVTPTSQIVAESAEFAEQFTFYPGDESQQPDPDIEAFMGAGNVPSYRGGAPYIVLPEWDVTDSGGRAPAIKAELASAASGTQGVEWLMVSGDTDSRVLRRSPDGLNWPASTIPGPIADVGFYRSAGEILGVGFPAAAISRDYGETWENHFYSLSGVSEHYNGAEIGGSWWVGSDNSRIISGGVATPTGLSLPSVASNGYYIYASVLGAVRKYSQTGDLVSSILIPGLPYWIRPTIYSGNGIVVVLWVDLDGGAQLSVIDAGDNVSSVDYPNKGEIVTGKRLIKFSKKMGLWVLVENNNIYYGSTIDNLDGSAGVLTETAICIEEDGEKFIIGCDNRTISYSVDGDTWTSLILTNLQVGRPVVSLCALDFDANVFGEKIPLSSIAEFIHDSVGIPAPKIDVSQLTDDVEGIVFADGYTGADAMRALMGWYFFDAGEYDAGSGYRINYVKRGGSAELTLTENDIVEGPEDWEREDSYERPRVLHIAYANPVADYGAPNVAIKRTSKDVLVVGERPMSVPTVHSDADEVAQRGDIAMTVIYTEIAGTYELVLPISMLAMAPTNIIGFSIRGKTRRLRLTNWRFRADGTIGTEWMADRQSAYTSNLTALPAVPSTPPPPSIVGPTISTVLDIPATIDTLDNLHMLAAASGMAETGWWGAQHQRRLEAESDFTTAATFSAPATIMGTLMDDVSDASEHFTDTTNFVRVLLYSDDELETYTQQQFLSEHGAFALAWEDSGTRRWEVLQYRDAVKVGERTWELTTLARGRLNTETAEHPTGSLFVLLDAGVRVIPANSSWIGQDIEHRAVSNGQLPDQAVPYTQAYTGESQREWPVAHLFAGLNGDDLEIAWVPRHRFGTDDAPVQSQNWRGYRVTATDGVNTLTADTTVEGHTFDVTGWSTPIDVSVSQLNRITGAGPAVTEEIA